MKLFCRDDWFLCLLLLSAVLCVFVAYQVVDKGNQAWLQEIKTVPAGWVLVSDHKDSPYQVLLQNTGNGICTIRRRYKSWGAENSDTYEGKHKVLPCSADPTPQREEGEACKR